MKRLFAWLLYLVSLSAFSQSISYPYPVRYLALSIEQQPVKMAYMDVMPSNTANAVPCFCCMEKISTATIGKM